MDCQIHFNQNVNIIQRFIYMSVAIFIPCELFVFLSASRIRTVWSFRAISLIHIEQCNRHERETVHFPSSAFIIPFYRGLPYVRGSPAYRREMAASIFPADGKLMPTPRGKHQLSPMRLEVNSQRASVTTLFVLSTNRDLKLVTRDTKRGREGNEGPALIVIPIFSNKFFKGEKRECLRNRTYIFRMHNGFAILLYSALQMTDKKKKKKQQTFRIKIKKKNNYNKFHTLRSFSASVI